MEFEVAHLAPFPDQEGVALGGIVFGGLAGDGAVLHGPELRQAFPAGQVTAIEEGAKALLGLSRTAQGAPGNKQATQNGAPQTYWVFHSLKFHLPLICQ